MITNTNEKNGNSFKFELPYKGLLLILITIIMCQSSYAQSPIPGQGNDKDWNFVVAPYLWFGGLNGTMGVGSIEADIDAGFSDIFSNLNMGFMLYGEARYKKFGVAVDWLTLSLNLDGNTPLLERAVKVEPKVTFLETSIIYNIVNSEKWSSDLHVGIRSWWVDSRMEVERIVGEDNRLAEGSASWVDPIVGIKGTYLPHKRWPINARVDIGGFGAGSEFTWNLQLGAGYRFAKSWTALLQYRHLGVDYNQGTEGSMDYFKMDTNLYGPLLGIMANF